MPFDDYKGPAKPVLTLISKPEEPWPNIPPAIVERMKRWINETVGTWTPTMTGDQALGIIAFMQGQAHVVAKMEQVARKQLEALRKDSIPSHVRKE